MKVCPKCGVLLIEGRTSCQSCGTYVQPQAEVQVQDSISQPSGPTPLFMARKKAFKAIGIIIVIAIITLSISLSITFMKPHLKIVKTDFIKVGFDTILVIDLQNNGLVTADKDDIIIRIDNSEEHEWHNASVEPGQTVTGTINLGNIPTFGMPSFIFRVEVLYNGESQYKVGV